MDLYSRRVNGRLFALDRCLGKLSSSKSYGLKSSELRRETASISQSRSSSVTRILLSTRLTHRWQRNFASTSTRGRPRARQQ